MLRIATFQEKVKQIIHKYIIVAGMSFSDQLRTHVMEFILKVQMLIQPLSSYTIAWTWGGG